MKMMMNPPMLSFLGLLGFIVMLLVTPPLGVSSSGMLYKGLTISALNITGRVACSTSSNPPASAPGIGGVLNLTFTCNGGATKLGSVLTDPEGFFDFLATFIDGLVTDDTTLPCVVTVPLPANSSCSVFPPKAVLRATLRIVGVTVNALLGLVCIVNIGELTSAAAVNI